MTVTWTDAARHALEQGLAELEPTLAAGGGDLDEVVADLRRHVAEEAQARGLRVVTEDDVRAILAAVGAARAEPAPSVPGEPAPSPPGAASPPVRLSRGAAVWLWAFGAILPLVALIFELSTRMCTEMLFDPLPTALHLALVAAVPLGNMAGLIALGRRRPIPPGLLFANGLGLGVALYYALVFAPLVPVSVMMVVVYGLGLLSLAPLLSLLAGLGLRSRLHRHAARPTRAVLWGFAAAVVALCVAGLPRAVTRYSLARAVEGSPEARTAAVRRLRAFGDREILLRACYERSGQMGDLESFILGTHEVTPEDARAVYYRVTGRPFNTVPPPRLHAAGVMRGEWEWDGDQGGPAVGGVSKGLTLAASRLDGSLDGEAALGYVEWTLEFRNVGLVPAEARAVVALPPGGAVSRATLWVDGVEREAAFGGRAAARAAYETVVRVRRDPLLVTSAGPDRVLVQCFPVPAGGTMKIRLGITAPLPVESTELARLFLPHFLERNFRVEGTAPHELWIEAKAPLAAPGLRFGTTPAGASGVRGEVADAALSTLTVAVARADLRESWASDALDPTLDVVQHLEPAPAERAAGGDVVVLDGSGGLAAEIDSLRRVLAEGSGPRPTVLVAGDGVSEVAVETLAADGFRGGMDDVPALAQAWDRTRGRVVWVHAAQPVLLSTVEPLRQRCERRPDGPQLIALAVEPGPNRIVDGLDGCPWLRVAPRRGALADDLRALLAGGRPDGAVFIARREQSPAGARSRGGKQTSDHLVRLWVLDRMHELSRNAGERDAATTLAIRYRIVTPLSGAVVLETAAEEQAAGLEPGDPHRIPTVPEPATLALLLIVTAALAVAWRPKGGRWLGRAR